MKSFYHEIGTNFIRSKDGTRVGWIEDDYLRDMALVGLNQGDAVRREVAELSEVVHNLKMEINDLNYKK